jgi:hypothetical protein
VAQTPYKPSSRDRNLVKALTACGNSHEEIAKVLSMKPGMVRKFFRDEIQVGTTQANSKILGAIFKAATQDNNMTAAIFWAKTQGGTKQKRSTPGAGTELPPSLVLKVQE